MAVDTLWLFNIAMENGPFIDGFTYYKWWFSMAMLNNQMVIVLEIPQILTIIQTNRNQS